MKLKHFIQAIPVLQLVVDIIAFFKWIDEITTTRLYHPDSLDRLHEADLYLKNRNKK